MDTDAAQANKPSDTKVDERKHKDEISANAIKVLSEPCTQTKIKDDYYMKKCDEFIHPKLLAIKAPKCSDFERIFNDFEKSFFLGLGKNSPYEMTLDEIAPVYVRMLTALQRYTY